MDHQYEQTNGGIKLAIEYMHDKAAYAFSNKDKAHILYNMTLKEIYDPLIYKKFEETYKLSESSTLTARTCFGGLWAYYKSN